jgi:hypothetical protein
MQVGRRSLLVNASNSKLTLAEYEGVPGHAEVHGFEWLLAEALA